MLKIAILNFKNQNKYHKKWRYAGRKIGIYTKI